MRSIPWVMTWEVLRRGRRSLPAALLGAIAFSMILLAALRSAGPLQPEAPHFIVMHLVLTLMNMMMFGAALFAAQDKPARLYTYPAANSTLVAWRLAPAMGLMAAALATATTAINAVFELSWPVWGPAMFLAVAWAAVQAVAWLAENSAWLPVIVATVIAAAAAWLKSQYGPVLAQPATYWRDVTAADAAAMLLMGAAAYATAVVAVGRNRRGEAPLSVGLVAWLNRVLDQTGTTDRAFATPGEAQFWFEWRRKGWVMPTAVAFSMAVGGAGWLIFSRDPGELFDALVAGGGFLPIMGLLGAVALGACGPREGDPAMGPFLATRPIATPEMSRAILKTAAKSALQAWAIWAAAFFALGAWLHATGGIPSHLVDLNHAWWYLPVTLLGPWTVAAVGGSLGLTGRPNLLAKAVCGVMGAVIGLTVFSELALSDAAQERLAAAAAGGCGIAFVAATVWVFAAARRRSLIERSTMIAAACVWCVLGTFAALGASFNAAPIPLVLFLLGLAALAVAPVAAAPLALAINRTR